jgi:para-nitrobenzyl esterase
MVGHRLGSAGWLRHPELAGPGGEEGNWGLLDQAAALRWVHEHAAVLGVDRTRAALVGESAGAGAALLHLAAPASTGLATRVVALSPPLGELVVATERAVAWAQDLAAACATTVPGLRDFDARRLVAEHEALLGRPPWAGTRGGALPSLDPATAPAGPLEDPAASLGVDVLVTTAADEGTFFFRQPGREAHPDPERLEAIVAGMPGVDDASAVLAEARERHGTDDANELLVRLATERIFTAPIDRWAQGRTAAGGRVERRAITHRSPQPGLGATHSIAVPLLFGTYATTPAGAWIAGAPGADAAAAELQGAVRAFVHQPGRSTG